MFALAFAPPGAPLFVYLFAFPVLCSLVFGLFTGNKIIAVVFLCVQNIIPGHLLQEMKGLKRRSRGVVAAPGCPDMFWKGLRKKPLQRVLKGCATRIHVVRTE